MKKRWYQICLFFCLHLLISIPVNANADANNSSISFNVPPKTPALTLIFKKHALINELYLLAPNGIQHSVRQEANGILNTLNYEVVQIPAPTPGVWILSGPQQQIEQILVLTNTDLDTNFITGIYFKGEYLSLSGYLEQEQHPLTTDIATQDMTLKLEIQNHDNKFSYVIPYNKNGIFNNDLILQIPPGSYKASWNLNSPYLSLKHQYMMVVYDSPFALENKAEHDALIIKLLKPELIEAKSVAIQIRYKDVPQKLSIIKNDLRWIVNLAPLCQLSSFSVDNIFIEISAQTTSGREMMFKLLLSGDVCSPNYTPMIIAPTKPAVKNKIVVKPPEKHVSPIIKYIVLIVIILLLLGVLLVGIRYWNKRSEIREEL